MVCIGRYNLVTIPFLPDGTIIFRVLEVAAAVIGGG
jgi:hypothetical protein